MNDDDADNTNNQPINLGNKATPDSSVFAAAATVASAASASANAPDTNSLSSGIKLDTEIFLKWSINNMDDN